MSKAVPTLDVPVPAVEREVPSETRDERETFASISEETARDVTAEQAFISSKVHFVKTEPTLQRAARTAALARLNERLGALSVEAPREEETRPIPGGVGFGFEYNPSFKTSFTQGTSLFFEIVCPDSPGGNVNTTLYLTATNRANQGCEALVWYEGNAEPQFVVFDWSRLRTHPWARQISFSYLGNYLESISVHGQAYRVLGVLNLTFRLPSSQWRNEVWLWNRAAETWVLIYSFEYTATLIEQISLVYPPLTWGPIVETFQPVYEDTNPMGALGTAVIGKDSSGAWGSWQLLSASNSFIRTDNKGFRVVFLDPNYAFVVDSWTG